MTLKSKLKGKKLIDLEKELASYKGEDRMISSHEAAEISAIEEKSNFSFSTGLEHIDNILGNVEAGELILVSGPTGHGKTSLMMTIIRNMAQKNINSSYFCFELTERQFFSKFDFKPPLFYVPKSYTDKNIYWTEERILESIVKYDTKIAYIDDLHSMMSLGNLNNASLEIGDLLTKIKDIAVSNNIVIFMQVHIKDPADGSTREPIMNDIRDSGLIKTKADSIMGVWRVPNDQVYEKGKKYRMIDVENEDTKAKVRVWKNRRSGTLGTFYLDMKNNFFVENYDKDGYPKEGGERNDFSNL